MKVAGLLLGYSAHLLLAGVIVLEFQVAGARHLDETELISAATDGDSKERAWAIHVLANRGEERNGFLNRVRIQGLITDPDPLVADMAYMVDICRLLQPSRQEKRLSNRFQDKERAQDDLEDWFRRYVFYRRKVGGRPLGASLRLKRQEVRWLITVLNGGSLAEEELMTYLTNRQEGTNQARMHRLAPNKKRERRDDEQPPEKSD